MAVQEHYSTQDKVRSSHRKNSFWQIWFPLIISLMLAITAAVFIVMLTFQTARPDFSDHWMSVSLVYLIFPSLFIAFIFIVLLVALIFLVAIIHGKLPPVMDKIITFLNQANGYIKTGTDRIASPVVTAQGVVAGVQVFLKRISLKR
jgi:hypothetical protein